MLQLLLYLDGNYWYPHLLSLLKLILNEDEPLLLKQTLTLMLFMLLSINYGSFVLPHAWLLVPLHWILHKCNNNFMFKKRLISEHVQHMFHHSLFEVVINEWTFVHGKWTFIHSFITILPPWRTYKSRYHV
jgi:hypothetical protein